MPMKEIGTGTIDHVEFYKRRQRVLWRADGDSSNCYQAAEVTFHWAVEYATNWLGVRVRVTESATGATEFERLPEEALREPPGEIAKLRKEFGEMQKELLVLRGANVDLLKVQREKDALQSQLERAFEVLKVTRAGG